MKLMELKKSGIWAAGFFEDETELTHNFSRLSYFSSKEKAAKYLIDSMIGNIDDEDFEDAAQFSVADAKQAVKKNDGKLLVSMADHVDNFMNEESPDYLIIFEPIHITA